MDTSDLTENDFKQIFPSSQFLEPSVYLPFPAAA